MENRVLTVEEAAAYIPALLQEDWLLPLLVTGTSMTPFLRPPAGYGIHSRHPALYAASAGRYFAVLPRGQQDADSPPNLPPVPGRFRSGQRRRTDLDGACTAHPDVRNCHANQSGRRKAIFCQSFGPADTPQTLEMAAAGPALPVSMGCRYPKEACRYIAVGLSPGRCATARLLMLWTSQA